MAHQAKGQIKEAVKLLEGVVEAENHPQTGTPTDSHHVSLTIKTIEQNLTREVGSDVGTNYSDFSVDESTKSLYISEIARDLTPGMIQLSKVT